MSYTPGLGPMGWVSTRYGHCYKKTEPRGGSGMFLNINRNLSPRLQTKPPEQVKEERKRHSATYYAYVRLLQKQKPTERTFTGEIHLRDERARARTAREVGKRLHKAMNIYQPAEAKSRPSTASSTGDVPMRKRVYTRSEVEEIFDRLPDSSGEKATDSNSEGKETKSEDTKGKLLKRFRKHQLYYPASEVKDAVDEYMKENHDSEKSGDSKPANRRPQSARPCAHTQDTSRTSRDTESRENKQNEENNKKSGGHSKDGEKTENDKDNKRVRRVQSAPPERAASSRKVTKRELEGIIERLTKYDRDRWPPESRGAGRIVAYEQ